MTATTNPNAANPNLVDKNLLARHMKRDDYEGAIGCLEKPAGDGFYLRVAIETLFKEEDELRETLRELGEDGQKAAELAAHLMHVHWRFQDYTKMLKQAAGRTTLMIEDMEARGEIVTTDAIYEPIHEVYDLMKRPPKTGPTN